MVEKIFFLSLALVLFSLIGLFIWACEAFQDWFTNYWDREVRRRKAKEKYEKIIKSKET